MKSRPWRFILAAAILLIGAQMTVVFTGQDAGRAAKPLESWLMGSQEILKDYLWFDLLQYFGAYSLGEHDLSDFSDRYERLIRLDRHFHRATIFACIVRASDMQDPRGALRWLELGEAENPAHWIYPYEQGFIQYLWLNNYRGAIEAFQRAGKCRGVPPGWRHFVARIHELGGDPSVACELWLQVAGNAEHPRIREAAMRNVRRLEAILHTNALAPSNRGS